ncbi:MAG TPA: NAD(P)/FAD-dependent oxidoreductase [Verrucomicrobiae bacterium]|nr:NAD(P)/FAD-dependent oxidoreductase [Verrucomicrobiae bacterium]
MAVEHFDVLIVGAGLSGVGGACHLQNHCPGKTYAVLEMREAMGGTWDLFRYPGIRSDSDMFTLGFNFRPWTQAKAIADGPSIRQYVQDTARENGVDQHIRYEHKVVHASWSSIDARWTLDVERGRSKERVRLTCGFLYMCPGYYDYAGGYTPDFPGIGDFKGRVVHPQKWTPDVEYKGKKVVVIGSGATAITLVPEMAKDAAHVTMLQRTPSYVASLPERDWLANALRKVLPDKVAYFFARWKNVLRTMFFYWVARAHPNVMKGLLRAGQKEVLGKDFDYTHFRPPYQPWDQRLCLVPDGDLFKSLRSGKSEIVTDHIERFTARGIQLKSGRELEADLIVTATGLKLLLLGGMTATVDGHHVDPPKTMSYRGMMVSDVPNLSFAVGYTNASWTLKCDLVAEYTCRLINYMDANGYRQCTPRRTDPTLKEEPIIDFSSGYVQRSIDQFPRQGNKVPWKLHQNYVKDLFNLRYGSLDDGVLEFAREVPAGAVGSAAR